MSGSCGDGARAAPPVSTFAPVWLKVDDAVFRLPSTTIMAKTAAMVPAAAIHWRYLFAGPFRALLIADRSAHDSCAEGTGAGIARISATVARSARNVAEQ